MRTRTPTRLRHGGARGRCGRRRPLPTGRERSGELLAEGHARPMEPGFHGPDRLTDQLGDLLVRELFDVPEGQHRRVVLGQRVERPFQRLARLTREKLTLRILRPVRQQERAVALAVAVLLERRQVLLERGLKLMPLAAPLVESRVRRDPVDPAPEGRASRERGALRRDREEDVLDDLLRVALIPRDAEGEPVDARGVFTHEPFERGSIAAPEPVDEPRFLAHRHPCALSCSATKPEQSNATPRCPSAQRSSRPAWSTKVTSDRSSASLAPSVSARSQARRSSMTHGPMTRPSSLSIGRPSSVLIGSILSIRWGSTLSARQLPCRPLGRGGLRWKSTKQRTSPDVRHNDPTRCPRTSVRDPPGHRGEATKLRGRNAGSRASPCGSGACSGGASRAWPRLGRLRARPQPARARPGCDSARPPRAVCRAPRTEPPETPAPPRTARPRRSAGASRARARASAPRRGPPRAR